MLRICGILLLSAIPVSVGWIKSRHVMIEKDELQGAIFMVSQFRQGICYSQSPVADIAMQIPKQRYEFVDYFSAQFTQGKSPKHAWLETSKKVRCQQITDILRDFFDSLGGSDRVSQLQICDMTSERLREMEMKLSETIIIRSKLSRTIGLLAGAFLAIILL